MIVGQYNCTPEGGRSRNPDGPWIWCCQCQMPKDWKGYVVEDCNQVRYLIGGNCGQQHYGALRFGAAKRAFHSFGKREDAIKRLNVIASAASEILSEIDNLVSCPALQKIESKRAEMQSACPDLVMRLSSVSLTGVLSAHEPSRNERGDVSAILVSIGPLLGSSLIQLEIRSIAEDARQSIRDAQIAIENVESLMTADIVKFHNKVGKFLNELLKYRDRMKDAPVFFSKSNVSRLERWSRPYARNFFSVNMDDTGGLIINDSSRGIRKIDPLESLNVPRLKACKKLASVR